MCRSPVTVLVGHRDPCPFALFCKGERERERSSRPRWLHQAGLGQAVGAKGRAMGAVGRGVWGRSLLS